MDSKAAPPSYAAQSDLISQARTQAQEASSLAPHDHGRSTPFVVSVPDHTYQQHSPQAQERISQQYSQQQLQQPQPRYENITIIETSPGISNNRATRKISPHSSSWGDFMFNVRNPRSKVFWIVNPLILLTMLLILYFTVWRHIRD